MQLLGQWARVQALPRVQVPLEWELAVRAGVQEPLRRRLHPLSLLQRLPKVALQLLPLPAMSSQQQVEGLHPRQLSLQTRRPVPQHPPLVAPQQPFPRSLWPRLPSRR